MSPDRGAVDTQEGTDVQRWGSEQAASGSVLLRTGALMTLASLGTAGLVLGGALGVGGPGGAGFTGAFGSGPSSVAPDETGRSAALAAPPGRRPTGQADGPRRSRSTAGRGPTTTPDLAAPPAAPLSGTTSSAARTPSDLDSVAFPARGQVVVAPSALLSASPAPSSVGASAGPAAVEATAGPAPAAAAPAPQVVRRAPAAKVAPAPRAAKPVRTGKVAKPAPKPAKPVPAVKVAKPVPAVKVATPVPAVKVATPVPAAKVAPAPRLAKPVPAAKAAKPAPAAEAPAPTVEQQTSAPAPGGSGHQDHPHGGPPGQAKDTGPKH